MELIRQAQTPLKSGRKNGEAGNMLNCTFPIEMRAETDDVPS